MKTQHPKIPHLSYLEPIKYKDFETLLKNLIVYKYIPKKDNDDEYIVMPKFNAFQAWRSYQSKFNISRTSPLLNSFIGYYYDPGSPEDYTPELNLKFAKWTAHAKRVHGERYEKWWNEAKLAFREHTKIGKLDVLYSKENGTGKGCVNKVFDELYRGRVLILPRLSAILSSKEIGNIDGIMRIHIEEWDILNKDKATNAFLKSIITGYGDFDGRVLFKNLHTCFNNCDIYADTNHLITGLVEHETERRIRGSEVPRINYEELGFKNKYEYFTDVMSEFQPNGPMSGFNPDTMKALATVLMYEPLTMDPIQIRTVPEDNAFRKKLLKEALEYEQIEDFTREYIAQLIQGINAFDFKILVENYIKKYPFKRDGHNGRLVNATATWFITEFNDKILKSKQAYKKIKFTKYREVDRNQRYYQFDNPEDAKEYIDEDEFNQVMLDLASEAEEK